MLKLHPGARRQQSLGKGPRGHTAALTPPCSATAALEERGGGRGTASHLRHPAPPQRFCTLSTSRRAREGRCARSRLRGRAFSHPVTAAPRSASTGRQPEIVLTAASRGGRSRSSSLLLPSHSPASATGAAAPTCAAGCGVRSP